MKNYISFLSRSKTGETKIGKSSTNYGLIAGIAVFALVFIFFSIKATGFLSKINLVHNLVMPAAISAVIAMGMTVVMAGGGIDLSVANIAGLAGLASAAVSAQFDLPVPLMFLTALIVGGLIGAINGVLVAYAGISPFVVTLSVVYLAHGLQYLISLMAVSGTYLMLPRVVTKLGTNAFFQIGFCTFTFILLFIYLDRSIFGRYIKAVGMNINAANFSGIPTRFYTWLTYVICGVCCAIMGIMLTANEGLARVGSGESYQIDAFLLPILGNTIFGRFSVQGTLFSALFIYMVINGMFIMGVSPEKVKIIKGGLLLGIILVSGIQKVARREN
ncbi:ABC transporter permease [Pelolinea submarina]|uniref:Ribose transport system permease protein n=1 Tax=Pelolinea submarina TaxID=913107 RepID=A0A347ZUN2_9CHLR|nr:ABC transporter permease [Pelolinea submarina]REG10401.1 ribose transport system permease protein [Pelolinea submarina]BBB49013.1 ribose transport system permease protein [Pelolinea submarina]